MSNPFASLLLHSRHDLLLNTPQQKRAEEAARGRLWRARFCHQSKAKSGEVFMLGIEPNLCENERLFEICLDDLLTVDGQRRAPF